jgi:hypothetical protein
MKSTGSDRYEIQTKTVEGKWTVHGVVEGDVAAAEKAWAYVANTLTAPARLVTHDYKGRIIVVARQGKRSGYRVTYGETIPVWSRILPSLAAANEFADKHRSFGDIVFSIEAVA